MRWIGVYFVANIFLLVPVFTEDYHCVWYGVCARKGDDLEIPCPVNHPAKPLEGPEDTLSILKRRCPHFFENGIGT